MNDKLAASSSVPTELAYTSAGRDRGSSAVALFQYISAPMFICILLSMFVNPTVGLVGLVLSAGFSFYWWKFKPTGGRLRIEGRELSVLRNGRRVDVSVSIDDLRDVMLDTKTIERVQEGNALLGDARFVNTKVGPSVDTSRIVLVRNDKTWIRLGDDYLAHMDATEALGKVRVFLRKHGWVPRDEQEDAPESEMPESEEDEDDEDDEDEHASARR